MNNHSERDENIGTYSRINLRLYCDGISPPKIHLIETYASGETGGMLLCTVPLHKEEDVKAFVDSFQKEAADMLSNYSEHPKTHSAIRAAAQRAFLNTAPEKHPPKRNYRQIGKGLKSDRRP